MSYVFGNIIVSDWPAGCSSEYSVGGGAGFAIVYAC